MKLAVLLLAIGFVSAAPSIGSKRQTAVSALSYSTDNRDSSTEYQDIVVTYPSVGEVAYAFDTCVPFRIDSAVASSARVSKLAKCFFYAYAQFSTLLSMLLALTPLIFT